ncbi:MAG: beta-galactosidase [Candidatus Sumerlaeota bacterium]|nr:beta-galactosidase [Candidatus Sumerlaeota bacterium]
MASLNLPFLLHGGDYNPEQWMDEPGIWDQDMRLMKLAHINSASIGIFSWVMLEPEEGRYEFDWLDDIFDRLSKNGQRVILATPSGAKPAWLSAKYPEIRRVQANGLRDPHIGRHNHCPTSPVYREKVRAINTRLAERYANHPALAMWHLSNEYGGYCYCDLCFAAFRQWLERRYGTLDALNRAWWTRFWSHVYTDWRQIECVDPSVHGMQLDWKRFMTDQCVDFMRGEIEPLRQANPNIPVTTNMMGTYEVLNYWKFVPHLDVLSWDSYPDWHSGDDVETACGVAFHHDIYRAMKQGRPFILMESTPSQTNWQPIGRPKRPGMHRLASLQAVAHGSDAVCYFQWRKSRGSSEKFHGAVVDHAGHEHTRVFQQVAALGAELEKLAPVAGSVAQAQVAVICDWECRWAIEQAQGPRNRDKDYIQTCISFYRPFWRRGVTVDVIDSECDFSSYKLLIAPMLYMLRPGVAERIAAFVEKNGVFAATYLTGIADEHDLCFLGGFPGPLRKVLGVWAEETDVLHERNEQAVIPVGDNPLGLIGAYEARHFCDIIHLEGASALAAYGNDFYAGQPALTLNRYGKGQAYYLASRNDARFLDDFAGALIRQAGVSQVLETELPQGVTAQRRSKGGREFIFLMNFGTKDRSIELGAVRYSDLASGQIVTGKLILAPFDVRVLERKK